MDQKTHWLSKDYKHSHGLQFLLILLFMDTRPLVDKQKSNTMDNLALRFKAVVVIYAFCKYAYGVAPFYVLFIWRKVFQIYKRSKRSWHAHFYTQLGIAILFNRIYFPSGNSNSWRNRNFLKRKIIK